MRLHSLRTKLQLAFVALGVTAIAITGWQASRSATDALRQAGYDRLTAVRETRASELERYFDNIRSQVGALATDTSTLSAVESLAEVWPRVTPASSDGPAALRRYYEEQSIPALWFPADIRTIALQNDYLVNNPHPHNAKDLLLTTSKQGPYDAIHARIHPTFHRYKTAFGYYDIFLISRESGRVLYTVMKEIDLGAALDAEPYRTSPLAAVYRKALEYPDASAVMTDYRPYVASALAPAAFVAAPLRRAGIVIGVVAIQVAIDEVDAVMSGGGRWVEQGFGKTGQVYAVGPDNTLRSDFRKTIENLDASLADLVSAGVPAAVVDEVRRNRTGVLAHHVNLAAVERIRSGESGTESGHNLTGTEVLRSHGLLHVGDLHWAIIAEIDKAEALGPVVALQKRILTIGIAIAIILFLTASWLAASITEPILLVAAGARNLGRGVRGLRISAGGKDEIAQLASDFNRMSEDLERTTVSKQELEILAGRLISAQEDERRRVARELHDDFTQRLAAAAIETGRLVNSAEGDPEALRMSLRRVKEQLAAVSDDVHSLSRRLHPRVLDDLGLRAAIEMETRAAFERGLLVECRFEGDVDNIPPDLRVALYRITQEALRNIQKHSGATEAELHLKRSDDSVEMAICDDGHGFDRSATHFRAGLGLASMEERTRLLGGRLHVESRPDEGTTVHVTFPVAHD